MKTLYLHIGAPKTGTSAIQKFCKDNNEVLERKGYCFRLMPFRYSDHPSINRNGHFLLGKVFDENKKLDVRATKERIERGYEITAEWLSEIDNVILSEESIWNALHGKNWDILKNIVRFCETKEARLKVIVYVRRQDEYLSSWWRQQIRIGRATYKWDDITENPPKRIILDYDSHLKKIEDIVGKDNIIVRRYERGSFKGEGYTIFSDFLDALGLQFTDEFKIQQETVNSSLTNNYAEMKRILNFLQEEGSIVNNEVSRFFERTILFCSRRDSNKERYSLFSPEEQTVFMKRYEEGNQRILRDYFPGEEALFRTDLTTLPKWEQDNPHMYEDTVLYFGKLALNQEQKIKELEKELKKTRKQIEDFQKEYRSDLRTLKKLLSPAKKVWGSLRGRKNA